MTGDRSWLRYDRAGRRLTLTLHIQPNAKNNAVAGPHGDALKVRVAAPAVDYKANAALIEFLSDTLGVPRSVISIRQGAASRRKVVEVTGGPELAAKLAQFG